ncbi:hypothetical protein ADK47_27290 [Streptomyces rimosus subsp. rimosus]|nr:hypothetical protein DF18_31060 [Streptomyces rimosus]KOG70478.1 hypothetical protein ADK78_29045 [Kitasatospora aureofaciens]KOT31865.1 hypothetical protein ADK84_29235 [Streptomyces sp. NRRL WC-3701]KOT32353.1 hypothetical protein ADK42_25980 [Streptomyces rimosus subsp. rimosus]KOT53282.1 hypothetical protein ADK44_29595 [Streptomyces rimosus subsp. rimosus]
MRGGSTTAYRVTFTVEAKVTADALPRERRDLLERGLAKLALDPYHELTAHIGTHEDNRKAQVAPGLLIEYVVARGLIVVMAVEVFDDVLLDD